MPPSLCIVIGSLAIGGCERHLSYILPRLVEGGMRVSILTLGGPNPLANDLRKGGVIVYEGLENYCPKWLPRPLRQMIFLCVSIVRLAWYFAQNRRAILHFFLPEAYILGSIIALFMRHKGPLVMSRRSMNDYQKKRPFLAKIEHALHKKMHLVLGNSKRVCDQLIREKAPFAKVRLLYNGIDTAPFDIPSNTPFDIRDARENLGMGSDDIVFITVANLIPYKGHTDLIAAFSKIHNHLHKPWKLLLVGRDDGIGESLQTQANEAGIGKYVHFLGSRRDTISLLRLSDIFILPTHQEGFSNAILEAMAANLPIIATDVGGNGEAVLHGKTGLIVPAHNPEALSQAINILYQDALLRGKMGEEGRARLNREFSLKMCVAHYQRIYLKLSEPALDIHP